MYCQAKKLLPFCYKTISSQRRNLSKSIIDIDEEVRLGLETGKPLVALESTIITHGMPFPENVKCALDVEQVVRAQGAIPATIGVIKGKLKVGLSQAEIEILGDVKASKPIKTSRRDLPYVISHNLNGGTTVCATLIAANTVGIPVFATGGIGGVHRNAYKTFDISADLIELGRCGVAVVSSGVKSILDIPNTLEYLETLGVFVATFGDTNEFPGFYSRSSGSQSPYCVGTAIEAAKIIKSNRDMCLGSGMLFAVPVPIEFAFVPEMINNVIEESLKMAKKNITVLGKNITPFLLSQVANITGGKSLQTNMALIKNNAEIAANISTALAELKSSGKSFGDAGRLEQLEGRPVVIGGSNLDCSVTLTTSDIKLDGRIHDGHCSYTAGGVGRNICESLCKLGYPPNFITAIGDDEPGRLLKSFIPQESSQMMEVVEGSNTAQCIIVFDKSGDCKFLMGDMGIHQEITPELVKSYENVVRTAPLIILDGNLSVECIGETLRLADKYSIPAFYEPTDVEISAKPFETSYWKAVKYITPNINELKHITSFLNIPLEATCSNKIEEAAFLATQLAGKLENVIVTLGSDGVLIARKGFATDPLFKNVERDRIYVRHYPGHSIKEFVNVSGAGDCLASGIVAAMISGLSEEDCLSVGFRAAQASLYTNSAVPTTLFNCRSLPAHKTSMIYTIL